MNQTFVKETWPELVRKTLLIISVVLLVPWAPYAMVSGMAFDGWPDHARATIVVVTVMWSYPFLVALGYVISTWFAWAILLPWVDILIFLIALVVSH
jgi:hypothetical protein